MSEIETNKSGIVRDTRSGALLSTDTDGLERHKKNLEQAKTINTIKSEIKDLKADLTELKTLLIEVLNK